MARGAVLPYSRKRKMNASPDLILVDPATTCAEIQSELYDSAFLADRGCLTSLHPKRKPRNVPLKQRKRA
jgi:hypothetical protein